MTAQQIATRMRRRADLVEPEFRKSSQGLAKSAVAFTKMKMTTDIYAIPEDVHPKTGEKLWRRTGHLRRSERAELEDAYTILMINDAAYSEPRHEAGKPNRRSIDKLRISHWRDDLEEAFAPIIQDVYHATVLDILKAGKI